MEFPETRFRTVQILCEEHAWIESMTTCLECLAHDASLKGRLDEESCALLMALFEYFADGLHQQKEESVLFARLLSRSSLSEKGIIAKLIGEHEVERRSMKKLHSSLLGAVLGMHQEVREFVRHARIFAALHRSHLAMENRLMLPMAEQLLDEETDRLVCASFERLEAAHSIDRNSVGEHVRRLCRRLGVQTRTP
jgi:hemerythrin-like domain-containing protein